MATSFKSYYYTPMERFLFVANLSASWLMVLTQISHNWLMINCTYVFKYLLIFDVLHTKDYFH